MRGWVGLESSWSDTAHSASTKSTEEGRRKEIGGREGGREEVRE